MKLEFLFDGGSRVFGLYSPGAYHGCGCGVLDYGMEEASLMGWSYCGEDEDGRAIGYGVSASCDHPGCEAKIDRGLSYACGGMHGGGDFGCGRYFCPKHLIVGVATEQLCKKCVDEHERRMDLLNYLESQEAQDALRFAVRSLEGLAGNPTPELRRLILG